VKPSQASPEGIAAVRKFRWVMVVLSLLRIGVVVVVLLVLKILGVI
jgi:hypothetical protein